MSNPWAQSFDDLRSPYLQEKKAKKDYDGDGKIESGAKEYRGVVHNKIQKAKGGKADGQDTSSVKEEKYDDKKVSMRFGDKKQKERKEKLEKKRGMKLDKHPQFESKAMKSYLDKRAKKLEKDKKKQSAPYKNNPAFGDPSHHSNKKNRMEHHRRDEDGNTIPHENDLNELAPLAPLAVGAGALGATIGGGKLFYDSIKGIKKRMKHDEKMKNEGAPYTVNVADKVGNTPAYQNYMKGMKNKLTGKPLYKAGVGLDKAHYDPESEIIDEADKKGKGSGSKDACYHKVKSRYSVWPSAYASGALVKCRKVGAKNWGNSSKKEEFDYYQMPMKSFSDMVGECWKTHEQRGMKKKGGKMVPNCVPKGSPRKEEVAYEAVKTPKLDIKETGVKNKIEINPEIKTEAAKAPVKK